MELRKRAKLNRPERNLGPSAQERCLGNIVWGSEKSKATLDGSTGEVALSGGSSIWCGLGILPLWPWRQCVSMAAGLSLAGLLALAQAWCVNAIHENLLWFSQLTVRVLRACLPLASLKFESPVILVCLHVTCQSFLCYLVYGQYAK